MNLNSSPGGSFLGIGKRKSATDEKWLDIESKKNAIQLTTDATEYVYLLANDPSVAHHRIAQNVKRAVPPIVNRTESVRSVTTQVKGINEDIGFIIKDMEDMCDIPTFKSVHSKIFCATEFARHLLQGEAMSLSPQRSEGEVEEPVPAATPSKEPESEQTQDSEGDSTPEERHSDPQNESTPAPPVETQTTSNGVISDKETTSDTAESLLDNDAANLEQQKSEAAIVKSEEVVTNEESPTQTSTEIETTADVADTSAEDNTKEAP